MNVSQRIPWEDLKSVMESELFILAVQCLTVFTALSAVFWTTWIAYRHYGDRHALQTAQIKYGLHRIRRMGVLSELWQIMYETNNSPVIHGFEYGPDSGFNIALEFWTSFSRKYVNWRSVPVQVDGRWFWREIDASDFDITEHCKHVRLKANGDARKALLRFVDESNMNRPFDPNRPYWEAWYISFHDDPAKAYAYGRFHHAIGDGILLNKILEMEHELLWNKRSRKYGLAKAAAAITTKEKTKTERSLRKQIETAMWIAFNLLRYTPFALCDLISLFWLESAPLQCGIHCHYAGKDTLEFNGSRKFRMGTSLQFPLSEIKAQCAKYATRADRGDKFTINDFVICMFCEAVHRYILKHVCHGDAGEFAKITRIYGKSLYLRFFTIFNMRSLIGSHLQHLVERYAAGFAENDISTVPIRLPCGDVPFERRLAEIHDLFIKLKQGPMPIITALILKVGHFLFGLRYVNLVLGRFSASKCTFTLSNLMGPRTPLLSGPSAQVQSVFNGTNPTHTPLSCGIMSYVDHISFTMVADERSIKDPAQFMQCLDAAYFANII